MATHNTAANNNTTPTSTPSAGPGRALRGFLTATALLCASQAWAITVVPTRAAMGADDTVNWAAAAADGTQLANPYSLFSVGGLGVTASTPAPNELWTYVQAGTAYTGNFTAGDVLLSTAFTDGPIVITFASAVLGVGFDVQHVNFGTFSGSMRFYSDLAGATLLGTVNIAGATSSGANDGSAPFFGGISTTSDVRRVEISVAPLLGGTGLSINHMSLITSAVPEPSTALVFALGLVGLGLRARLRHGTH
jgi:PEP-CTERM motif